MQVIRVVLVLCDFARGKELKFTAHRDKKNAELG